MKKLVSFIIFVLCLSLSTVYAGGWGHGGGGYSGGRGGGGYGHGGGHYGGGGYRGGGYYGGHGGYYNNWAVGINLGGYPYYGYGAPYYGYGYGYAPGYYAPAPVFYAPTEYVQSGHWETQQSWVPGSQGYWVDQYYDKGRDVWVLGHWEERPGGPGYWSQQQVWVVQ